jgi:two-component system cell cycle response regulator
MAVLSVGKVVFRIAIIIALVELFIMLSLGTISDDLDGGKLLISDIKTLAFIDAVLLVLLASPLIYFWVVKPYVRERDDALGKATLQAHYDPLTQLANRRLIDQNINILIARCIRRKTFGALLLIDLDKFKPINDNYGHDAGDVILVEIAKRLSSAMRDEDVVGRIGGDEYVVLIDQLDDNEQLAINKAILIADKLLNIINAPLDLQGKILQVESSIGISIFGMKNVTSDQVFKRADIAMYQAKQRPVKHVVYSDPI